MATALGYLYRHIRLDKNEPFYIGIGFSSNPDSYSYKGFYRAYTKKFRNEIWKRITNKTKYEIEILLENLSLNELKEKEIEFIKLYGRINNNTGILANITDGGQRTLGSKHNLGKKHTALTKIKIRLKTIGICKNYNKNLRKPILEYDDNMNLIREHESVRSTKNFGFDPNTVSKCCKGYRDIHKGSIFKYKNTI